MQANDHNGKPHGHPEVDAENPVIQDSGPGGVADEDAIRRASQVGINPINTSSMSRAEDDEEVLATSPEFHDNGLRRNR